MGRTLKVLLDTCTFLWFAFGEDFLPTECRAILEAEDAENYVSVVTLLEIAQKHRIGKLPGVAVILDEWKPYCRSSGFTVLDVNGDDAVRSQSLQMDHKDPFDRLLIAQALLRDMPLMTCDSKLSYPGLSVMWKNLAVG